MTYQVDTLCQQPPIFYSYDGADKRQYDVIHRLALECLHDHETTCRKCRRLRAEGGGRSPESLVRQVRRPG